MRLTDKYRPTSINGFVGLDKAKKVCGKLASKPFDSSWLFVGASGTGKTTLALALVSELEAELHHIPSGNCTVDAIKELRSRLAYLPPMGKRYHVVLIDEADQMTVQAQLALLSMLDATNAPQQTIFIFTCNETERFEARFISRCGVIEFSSYGIAKDATALLSDVWTNEADPDAVAPNFARIVKESNNNIRAALLTLQNELMMS